MGVGRVLIFFFVRDVLLVELFYLVVVIKAAGSTGGVAGSS